MNGGGGYFFQTFFLVRINMKETQSCFDFSSLFWSCAVHICCWQMRIVHIKLFILFYDQTSSSHLTFFYHDSCAFINNVALFSICVRSFNT